MSEACGYAGGVSPSQSQAGSTHKDQGRERERQKYFGDPQEIQRQVFFMQHLLNMFMEVEISQKTYSTENQWQTKNCEGFLSFGLV